MQTHLQDGMMAASEPWLQSDSPSPHGYWQKLWAYFGPGLIMKDFAPEVHCTKYNLCDRKRLVVGLLIILAVVIMGLLLLWNYKCIMVWHLCDDDGEYAGLPNFGGG